MRLDRKSGSAFWSFGDLASDQEKLGGGTLLTGWQGITRGRPTIPRYTALVVLMDAGSKTEMYNQGRYNTLINSYKIEIFKHQNLTGISVAAKHVFLMNIRYEKENKCPLKWLIYFMKFTLYGWHTDGEWLYDNSESRLDGVEEYMLDWDVWVNGQ